MPGTLIPFSRLIFCLFSNVDGVSADRKSESEQLNLNLYIFRVKLLLNNQIFIL